MPSMLLSIIPAAWLWWAAQLWGLPDIGDPFDVASFHAQTIPDDRNAFVLYRQAAARFKPLIMADGTRALPSTSRRSGPRRSRRSASGPSRIVRP